MALYTVYRVISTLLMVYEWIIIIRVIFDLLRIPPFSNPFSAWIYRITEPFFRRVRIIIPLGNFGIDLAPLVALIVLWLISYLVDSIFRTLIF